MKTYFNQRLTWIKLRNENEAILLQAIMKEVNYDGEFYKIDHDGTDMYALVKWPESHKEKTLTGQAHKQWELVKSIFYRIRKA